MGVKSRLRKMQLWKKAGAIVEDIRQKIHQRRQRHVKNHPTISLLANGENPVPPDRGAPAVTPNPDIDAIHGNEIWGVEGAPPSGTLKTCNDGGTALQLQTAEGSNRSDVSDGPMVFMQLGAQFEHQESFATQASIGLDLDSPKDPTAVAKQKLKEMDVDLREASRKPFEGPEFYIPNNSLDSIMTRDAIRTVLPCITPEDMPDDSLDELARDVHGRRVENNSQEIRFRKILAVLVLIGKAETILDFLKAGVTDAELPLKILGESRLFRLAFSTSDKPIRLFRNWEPRHIENFAARQWETLAPFFSRGTKEQSWVHRYDLVWRHPLPFEIIPEDETVKTAGIGNASSGTTSSTSSLDSMRGGNSRLWKVRIHHAHHNLPSYRGRETNPALAIKRLATADRATFKNEVNILTRLNKCNDPHLVKLLLTMEIVDRPGKHHSAYFLIFPLADGNLRQFWKLESPQQGDVHKATYPRWVAKQFYGLVWALCKLHDLNQREAHSLTDHGDDQQSGAGDPFYGIHGDIKPENLLWYKDWIGPAGHQSCPGIIPPKDSVPFGVLQLADFGISKLHHTATRSNNNMRRSTKTYAPPEAEWGVDECSRSFDIWSLGCVFLEFLCWLVLGGSETDPIEDFHQARYLGGENKSLEGTFQDTFYRLVQVDVAGVTQTKVEVNPAVKNLVVTLKKSPRSSAFVNDVLDIILGQMLVIEAKSTATKKTSEGPQAPENKRIECVALAKQLRDMVENKPHDEYFTKPSQSSPDSLTPETPAITIPKSAKELIQRRRSMSRTFPPYTTREDSPRQDQQWRRASTIHEI